MNRKNTTLKLPKLDYEKANDDEQVAKVVEFLISEDRSKSDAMENTKRVLYFACIYYLYETDCVLDKSVYSEIFHLIEAGIMSSYDRQPESELDRLMRQAELNGAEQGKESQAAANYNIFKIAAPDTERNVLISCLLDLKLLDNKYHFLEGEKQYE